MQIAVIGYRNHAAKLIKLVNSFKEVKKIFVYHPDKNKIKNFTIKSKKIFTTNDISKLDNVDGIIISSKSNSHAKYLNFFSKKKKYIFCEKPPADNKKDLFEIKKLKKNKIKFNFHLIQTFFSHYVKKILLSKELGDPINITIEVSHGIAFKKIFNKNWRFNEKNIFSSITGNSGIHYIRQLLFWFKKIKLININQQKFSRSKSIDTANINLLANDRINVNIFLSYAAPKINNIKIIFTNGYLEMKDGKINKFFPRDIFDMSGQFKSPKLKKIKYFKNSTEHNYDGLIKNLKVFIEVIKNKKYFKESEFKDDLKSAELILKMK
tara:strand:+ start:379 stop:1347 length:969 start_codon:yes stop_codon:yes gene_type:complete